MQTANIVERECLLPDLEITVRFVILISIDQYDIIMKIDGAMFENIVFGPINYNILNIKSLKCY